MELWHLIISIIYILLSIYYIYKARKYPQQVYGNQYHYNVNGFFIGLWYVLTTILVIFIGILLINIIPWNLKIL